MKTLKNFYPIGFALLLSGAAAVFAQDAPEIQAPYEVGGFTFNQRQIDNRFFNVFRAWAVEDEGNLPRRESTLCVGSSSMRRWGSIKKDLAPLDIIHRGFGGSTMAHTLVYKDFLGRYEAERIIVYQGDNDLANPAASVDQFIAECEAFIEYIHGIREDTEIHFITIKPSVRRIARTDVYREANQRLADLCAKDDRLFVIDVFTPMLNEEGNPRPELMANDDLHLNDAGYEVWRKVVREALALDELTTDPSTP